MIEQLGGRKFILALISIAAAAALVVTGHTLTTQMVSLFIGIISAFTIGNNVSKFVNPQFIAPKVEPVSNMDIAKESVYSNYPENLAESDYQQELPNMSEQKLDQLIQSNIAITQAVADMSTTITKSHEILVKATQQRPPQ